MKQTVLWHLLTHRDDWWSGARRARRRSRKTPPATAAARKKSVAADTTKAPARLRQRMPPLRRRRRAPAADTTTAFRRRIRRGWTLPRPGTAEPAKSDVPPPADAAAVKLPYEDLVAALDNEELWTRIDGSRSGWLRIPKIS